MSPEAFICGCGWGWGRAGREDAEWPLWPPSVARSQKSQTNWLKKTSRPLGGPGELSGLGPAPALQHGVGGAPPASGPPRTQRWGSHKANSLGLGKRLGPTVRIQPQASGRAHGEQGWGTVGAPPPPTQCPPLSGRSWLPLPLGGKAPLSFPAADGGCWTEGSAHQRGGLPAPRLPPALRVPASPAPRGGKAARRPTFCDLGLLSLVPGDTSGTPATTTIPRSAP